MKAARVVPAGAIIKREIDARGWTQKDLAFVMNRPEKTISTIVCGHKRITPETALDLENALGVSAETWMALDANYRIHVERERRKRGPGVL